MSSQTPGRPTSIEDAGADAPPTTAGPGPLEQRAFATMRALDAAAAQVEKHKGPRSGPTYDAKVEAWRKCYAEWRTAMRAYASSEGASC